MLLVPVVPVALDSLEDPHHHLALALREVLVDLGVTVGQVLVAALTGQVLVEALMGRVHWVLVRDLVSVQVLSRRMQELQSFLKHLKTVRPI